MKKIFLSLLLLVFFVQLPLRGLAVTSINPLAPQSVNDLIIVSDVEKIAMNANTKKLNARALDQFKLANESYIEGVRLLQQDKFKKSIAALKTAYKNYNRAKLNNDAMNFIYVQMAVAYVRSQEPRDEKKALKFLESVSKSIYKEKVWAYNIAVMKNILKQEEDAAEILEGVIKKDKFFFKAYEDLADIYNNLNENKKAEKILTKLSETKDILANKERKKQAIALKEKEKTGIPKKPSKKNEHPKGIIPLKESLEANGNAQSLMKNESISNFSSKARKQLKKGEEEYLKGLSMYSSGEYDLAAKAFKSALKKYDRAKVKQITLDYISVQLAMSYARSPNKRSKKKVAPLLEDLDKDILKEQEWAYNVAVMYYHLEKKDKALDLLNKCTNMDKYFLTAYQNKIAIYNEQDETKKALKAFREHEKYKDELTDIYRNYVKSGNLPDGIDFSFLEGAIFRISLGDFNEYYLPVDIFLHDNLLIEPLGNDYYTYVCGNYSNFIHAENYIDKILIRYPEAHVVAFKDGKRTDFSQKKNSN